MPTEKTIAIVGSMPPPFGGVSVHVLRELELLGSAGYEVSLYEQTGKSVPQDNVYPLSRSKFKFLKFLLSIDQDLIHFHFANHVASALTGLVLRLRPRQNYIATVHGEGLMENYNTKGVLFRKCIELYFRNAAHVIGVNQNVVDFLRDRLTVSEERISLIPAFLPPTSQELDPANIPVLVTEFTKGKTHLIGSHGWFGFFRPEGVHVYGFDMLCRIAEEISQSGKNIGMYTVISGVYDEEHRREILAVQEKYKDHWLIVETSFTCASLYKKTSLFLRPTSTDGDSVSIRECLALGVPVLASDAVPRPAACEFFRSRDFDHFSERFWQMCGSDNDKVERQVEAFDNDLLSVIRSVLDDT